MSKDDGGPAFPQPTNEGFRFDGMSLHDWFAGQALSNPAICNGIPGAGEIVNWFGKNASCITRYQIAAMQASDHADAMLAARTKGPSND